MEAPALSRHFWHVPVKARQDRHLIQRHVRLLDDREPKAVIIWDYADVDVRGSCERRQVESVYFLAIHRGDELALQVDPRRAALSH